ncbi:hypothetical protein PFISCL1PPCAC_17400 [Pristionchus fissidentatus]|uniref:Uncharacterized protein n=1 Tax=Pristionchus fissidentatus TaxID=1538716 RepID=A0AAV5W3F9_9BILA|nr:hypothetical protein PFISCL1PPCAC_17400 [Pristionchus fissidentatus]
MCCLWRCCKPIPYGILLKVGAVILCIAFLKKKIETNRVWLEKIFMMKNTTRMDHSEVDYDKEKVDFTSLHRPLNLRERPLE